MTSPLHDRSTAATRSVTTRRMTFDFDDLGPDRHYLDHDLIDSHLVTVLSALIPAGERFIADAVRHYRDDLEGPLHAQTNGLIGQETVHQREHDRFNEALGRLGYPTALVDRASAATFAIASRLPPHLQVAMTAAVEHWTAVIAEHMLDQDLLETFDMPAEARAFLAWHLVEEVEHRAVAFDAMQSVGIGEAERVFAMRLVVAMLAPAVVGGLALSLVTDRATWNPLRLARSLERLRRSVFLSRAFRRDLLRYGRRDFHPDQRDLGDRLEQWRAAHFGPDGRVTARHTYRRRAS